MDGVASVKGERRGELEGATVGALVGGDEDAVNSFELGAVRERGAHRVPVATLERMTGPRVEPYVDDPLEALGWYLASRTAQLLCRSLQSALQSVLSLAENSFVLDGLLRRVVHHVGAATFQRHLVVLLQASNGVLQRLHLPFSPAGFPLAQEAGQV